MQHFVIYLSNSKDLVLLRYYNVSKSGMFWSIKLVLKWPVSLECLYQSRKLRWHHVMHVLGYRFCPCFYWQSYDYILDRTVQRYFLFSIFYKLLWEICPVSYCFVMVRVLTSCEENCRLSSRPDQTKDSNIAICCISATFKE